MLFVPDYHEPGMFRGPGAVRVREETLQIFNARPCYLDLFRRFGAIAVKPPLGPRSVMGIFTGR